MTCHSGGSLAILVDPCLPKPQVVLVGYAPVVETLATVAAAAGFDVIVCAPQAAAERFPAAKQVVQALDHIAASLDPHTYVVVATHGEADEEALAVALRSQAGYVALVSSPPPGGGLPAGPAGSGPYAGTGGAPEGAGRTRPWGHLAGAHRRQYRGRDGPAPLRARGDRRRAPGDRGRYPDACRLPPAVVDPVCGITVEIGDGTPSLVHDGQTYDFCCPGCYGQFHRPPARFLAGVVPSTVPTRGG